MLISIIIPVFNEKKTILKLIYKIKKTQLIHDKEIIIVDDNSDDGSRELIKKNFKNSKNFKIFYHKKNSGKGAAIKTAQKAIRGDIVIIQDADLEYNPLDYQKLIYPIIKKKTKVVYGSRVLGKKRYSNKGFTSIVRIFGNHMLTILSNIINNQRLTDAHTCYKVFYGNLFKKIKLKENDFCFCPEVTSKIANLGYKIKEVPIRYNGRKYSEGKKIRSSDAVKAVIALIKYGLLKK
jgi:dolichol-phosphate mannosyltransferase